MLFAVNVPAEIFPLVVRLVFGKVSVPLVAVIWSVPPSSTMLSKLLLLPREEILTVPIPSNCSVGVCVPIPTLPCVIKPVFTKSILPLVAVIWSTPPSMIMLD